jgi:lysophospholipase L1-like esterase
MKLFTFGDSWTEGVGGDLIEEEKTNSPEERTKIRQNFCWPKHLSDLLEVEFQNYGVGGASNKSIFDIVSHSIHNYLIKKDDLVLIMWSSSLRDDSPFFPRDNSLHFWGERYMTKKHIYKHLSYTESENVIDLHKSLKKDYKEFFLENLFSDQYYNIINQNYILYLQFMFDRIGVRYVFCDAFDTMIKKNILKEIDKTDYINKNHYWNFSNKTFKDHLCETNKKEVWEDKQLWDDNHYGGKHPSKFGYQLIAKELYHWILEKNILNYITKDINKRII